MVYLGKEGVMSKTTRRTLLVLLVLAVTSLTLPLAASAAAKAKPAPPAPIYYEVTMILDGATDGLETTCEAGPIRMLYDSAHGMLMATGENDTEVARLFVQSSIPWIREYPYHLGQSGVGFQECHGGQTPTSSGLWGGNLMISVDVDRAGNATPTRVLWHFDHYVEQTVVRRRVVTSLLEGFTLSSGDTLTYDSGTHYASGTFALFRWYPGTYELQGTSPFGFTLTLNRLG